MHLTTTRTPGQNIYTRICKTTIGYINTARYSNKLWNVCIFVLILLLFYSPVQVFYNIAIIVAYYLAYCVTKRVHKYFNLSLDFIYKCTILCLTTHFVFIIYTFNLVYIYNPAYLIYNYRWLFLER